MVKPHSSVLEGSLGYILLQGQYWFYYEFELKLSNLVIYLVREFLWYEIAGFNKNECLKSGKIGDKKKNLDFMLDLPHFSLNIN